ncbi:phosphatase PAP2 family protein [Microbacterium algeriense]|uniref:phosphatase PAP2 family protein n=1 Tax=Microbacterium algeriense TaxID=2615184 RepID=UPI0022E4CA7F|nr:phosphatase PAP2 family protein [Microbacterium algeriense]
MPSFRLPLRAALPLAVASGFAVLLLIVPMPGSLSVLGTRWLSSLGSAVPGIDLVSEVGLVLLAAITAAAIARAWRGHPERRLQTAAAAGGVLIAYLLSEGGKVLFAQARPCAFWEVAGECPPPGDWSLPSNHATLAFGATAVIAVALGRSWLTWATVALATVVAVGRVAQGVHYLHDIALGALLGAGVPLLLVIAVAARRALRQARSTGPRT